MIGRAYLKLYPSCVLKYLEHVCTRNQPQPLQENGKISNLSVQLVIGCNSNSIVDEISEIMLSFTIMS